VPQFRYKALKGDGSVDTGPIEAGGRQEAFRILEGRGLTPVALEEGTQRKSAEAQSKSLLGFRRSTRVPFRVLENFTRQLSSLLAAGVPLARALQILQREADSPVAREQWKGIHDLVVDGATLADAMNQWPQTFPRVYTAMIQAGEMGGFLDVVLGQIAEFQGREKELKGRVVSALVYPAILLILSIGVLIFLLTFFIPRFKSVFAGFGASLPWLTQAIIAASGAVVQYGPFLLVAVVVGFIMLRRWLKSDAGRRSWEKMLLRMPVLGPLNSHFALTRFCRMLGTLTGSGVPLMSALKVARESIGNQTLVDALTTSMERVKQGDALSTSLADCPALFTSSVLEMISVAEEAGTLDKELVRLAAVTESDLDRQLKMAVSLAEPLTLFVMAAFIGTIFIGMVLPIFTLQEHIK
jgi:type II secretory pathway component PulF